MPTTLRSSLSSVTQEALLDELEKIATGLAPKDGKTRESLKRWAKNTAIIAGGYGAGQLLAMGAEKVVKSKFGPAWAAMPAAKRMRILGPALGLTAAGVAVAAAHLKKTKEEADRE